MCRRQGQKGDRPLFTGSIDGMFATDVARWFVWLVAFAWGAAWGSFFNVAIYRWPRGMSVVTPLRETGDGAWQFGGHFSNP